MLQPTNTSRSCLFHKHTRSIEPFWFWPFSCMWKSSSLICISLTTHRFLSAFFAVCTWSSVICLFKTFVQLFCVCVFVFLLKSYFYTMHMKSLPHIFFSICGLNIHFLNDEADPTWSLFPVNFSRGKDLEV